MSNMDGAVEIEGKFRVDSLDEVCERLLQYGVEGPVVTHERNTMHDLCGILSKLGWTMRLRSNGGHYLTFKAGDTGEAVSRRREFEYALPEAVYRVLSAVLPITASYEKTRATYVPLDDKGCVICLDDVHGKGLFVEIEAQSEEKVLQWKGRLGITSPAIRASYGQLVGGE